MNQPFFSGPISGLPLSAIIAGMLSLLVAGVVHLLLWRMRRETYLLLWGLAWCAFAIRYAPMLWGAPFDPRSAVSVVGTARDLLFVVGAFYYTGRRWWRWLMVPAALEVLLILSGSLRHPTFGPLALGVRLGSAVVALLIVAAVLARSERYGRLPRRTSVFGLLILAGVLFVSPSMTVEVSVFLAVLIQLGALSFVLSLAFAELDEASALRLVALKKLEGTMQHALRGHANVCADCNRVEAADGVWCSPEAFIYSSTNARVTHGICPVCAKREFGIDSHDAPGAA